MKNFISFGLLVVAAITITFSCKKTQNPPSANSSEPIQTTFDIRTDMLYNETFQSEKKALNSLNYKRDISKIIEITNIKDEDSRRIAVSMLSTSEKIDFWEYVIQYHIDNDNYTNYQKLLLTVLKNTITTQAYFTNSNLQSIFNTQFLPQIKNQFNAAGIPDDKIAAMFTDGRLNYTTPTTQIIVGGGPKMKCDCGNYIFETCNRCLGDASCTEKTGCGFLWLSLCTGLCNKYMPATK
ncbi:MAG: bacteriocin fulvocin C-related protein [Bacteroidetes bacterium]|nr:bacteriocin fulvocin C-related protein [Bacteroidota bacterium]